MNYNNCSGVPTQFNLGSFSEAYFCAYEESVVITGPGAPNVTVTNLGDCSECPTTTTTTVFDGFQYTHATVAAFDLEGKKLWDKTFEMWPSYKPFMVKRFISISTENDKIDLLFATGNTIRSFSVNVEGSVANERSANLITETDDAEKVKRSSSNLTHWYGNTFIASGYQTIKDSEEKIGNKKRSYFFINKIVYE